MTKSRPVVAEAFGKRLAELRGATSHQGVTNRLAALGIKIDPSTLWQYEHGTVAAPDPRVLWGYCRLFGGSIEELTGLLVGEAMTPQERRFTLTADEVECLERWRSLSAADRAWFDETLDRLTGAPARGAGFRRWNGKERRTGKDRRAS